MSIQTFTHTFEGAPLVTLTWRGRPAWIARHIGERLGYAHGGKRLPNTILGEWSDEFIQGVDYAVLSGEDLAELKALPGAEELAPSVHHRLLVLFESGLHLALIKTRKPHGKRLRRFLAEEVMPQLVRNGTLFDGSTNVPPPTTLDGAEDADRRALPVFSLAQRREARLAHQADIRDRWVEFCDRRFRVQTIHRLIDRYQGTFVLPATEAAVLEFTAAALAVEEDIFHIVAPDDDWKTVTQLAVERGVSPGVIQQIIVDAELRGDPTYSRRVARSVQLPGVSKVQSVLSWTYNQAAAAIIDDVLDVTRNEDGPRPLGAA